MATPSDARDVRSELIVAGFLALFLELTLIRFLPANVLSLWYFSNIVLVSSFLGIGLGALAARRFKDVFIWFPVALLVITALFISLRVFEVVIPAEGSEWMWNFHYPGNQLGHFLFSLDIYSTLAIVFSLTAFLFTFVGQKIALLMSRFEALDAYGLDLIGAFFGVVSFGVLSFAGGWFRTPSTWFLVVAVASLYLLRKHAYVKAAAVFLAILIGVVYIFSHGQQWSSYYSIQTGPGANGSLQIYVNRFFYQQALDFEQDPNAKWKYLLPYHFQAPKRVLILGAGSGNDVATAVSAGVPDIDAVEIDPALVDIGIRHHPESPYQNPNVHIFIDDARSFLKRSTTKYDMIVLGTLDSHALLSAMSTVRLDNFVYTNESLKSIREHLTDDGIVALQFSSPNEAFAARLLRIASAAFSDMPSVAYWSNNALFNTAFIAGPGFSEMDARTFESDQFTRLVIPQPEPQATLPTDDWPYLYLSGRGIPAPYLKALAILLALSFMSIGALLWRQRKMLKLSHLNFFVLGAAFLLLETKSITSLSLLFGSTWLVNAFVIGAILLMLYLANLYVANIRKKPVWVAYGLLFGCLALNFLLPPDLFAGIGYWTGAILAALIAASPVFFSAIVFSYWFEQVPREHLGLAYGTNLLGAVFGGFLEYLSMITGLRMLYVIVALLYFASFALLVSKKRS